MTAIVLKTNFKACPCTHSSTAGVILGMALVICCLLPMYGTYGTPYILYILYIYTYSKFQPFCQAPTRGVRSAYIALVL